MKDWLKRRNWLWKKSRAEREVKTYGVLSKGPAKLSYTGKHSHRGKKESSRRAEKEIPRGPFEKKGKRVLVKWGQWGEMWNHTRSVEGNISPGGGQKVCANDTAQGGNKTLLKIEKVTKRKGGFGGSIRGNEKMGHL